MDTHLFDFVLPDERIARYPIAPRDNARLLHVAAHGASNTTLVDRHVYDLPTLVQEGDVVVLNDTRVIPARLTGYDAKGRPVEVMLDRCVRPESVLEPVPETIETVWHTLVKGAKRLKEGDYLTFAADMIAQVRGRSDDGLIILAFDGSTEAFHKWLTVHGTLPLPPYMNRAVEAQDLITYQTVYAQAQGAVAAPTAGLHLTEHVLEAIKEKGALIVTCTLHVGAGTFRPVHTERLDDHVMHAEWGFLSAETTAIINARKGRLIAIGTTSLRLLESAADNTGWVRPFSGETRLFLYPGVPIHTADVLMTNFHVPRSTLLMLVGAFGGMTAMQQAYAHALRHNYRFYSYGDAMWLERSAQANVGSNTCPSQEV